MWWIKLYILPCLVFIAEIHGLGMPSRRRPLSSKAAEEKLTASVTGIDSILNTSDFKNRSEYITNSIIPPLLPYRPTQPRPNRPMTSGTSLDSISIDTSSQATIPTLTGIRPKEQDRILSPRPMLTRPTENGSNRPIRRRPRPVPFNRSPNQPNNITPRTNRTNVPPYNRTPVSILPNFPTTPNYGSFDPNSIPLLKPMIPTPIATEINIPINPFDGIADQTLFKPTEQNPLSTDTNLLDPNRIPTVQSTESFSTETGFPPTTTYGSPEPSTLPPFQSIETTQAVTEPQFTSESSYSTSDSNTLPSFNPTEPIPFETETNFPSTPNYDYPDPNTLSSFQPTEQTLVETYSTFPPTPSDGTFGPEELPPFEPTDPIVVATETDFPPVPSFGTPEPNTLPPFPSTESTQDVTEPQFTSESSYSTSDSNTLPSFNPTEPIPFSTETNSPSTPSYVYPDPNTLSSFQPTEQTPVATYSTFPPTPSYGTFGPEELPPFEPTDPTVVATETDFPLVPSFGTPEPNTLPPFQSTESTQAVTEPQVTSESSYSTSDSNTLPSFKPTEPIPFATETNSPSTPSYDYTDPNTLPSVQPTEPTPVSTDINFPPTPSYGTPDPNTNPPFQPTESTMTPTPTYDTIKPNKLPPFEPTEPNPKNICEEKYAYYSVDYECDTFIECQEYVSRKRVCPDGLLFNPRTIWPNYPCVYPSQIECGNRMITQKPKPTGECPRQNGIFPSNTGNCGQYMVCDNGRAVLMNCPEGLAFNPEENGCDWPENVPTCKPNVFQDFTCPLDGYSRLSEQVFNYRYKNSCDQYIACLRGEPRLLRCDAGLSFDENTGRCIYSSAVLFCDRFTT